ncbi:MAG TPA: RIP metalloprotease RseP [Steroidobacteraceae bacterium]|nr:RIP metalloprotease RseP [Steroidobacteraceae bacterium]
MSSLSLSGLPMTIAAFIVAIVILVGVHEFGHFWVARRLGIRVLKFSIGFGKPLWKRTSKKDGVEYVIGSIPMGGYVKLLGERNDENEPVAPEDLPYSFQRAPVWKRVAVLLAGPAANLLLAVVFYWIVLLVGSPALKPVVGQVAEGSVADRAGLQKGDLIVAIQDHQVATQEDAFVYLVSQSVEGSVQLSVKGDEGSGLERKVKISQYSKPEWTEKTRMIDVLGFDLWKPTSAAAVVHEILAGSAAEKAGLLKGDTVIAVAGQPVPDFQALLKAVEPQANKTIDFKILRDGAELTMPVTVGEQTVDGRVVGRIGVSFSAVPSSMLTIQKYGPLDSIKHAVINTWDACVLDLQMIGKMITGKLSVKNLSGAVGIAEVTGEVARQGLLRFIGWLAFFSINLGILNLLPIPMLDGGQVVYHLIELVKGSPVSERFQLITQQIGIAALIMLVSLTLYNDIARHLS